MNAHDKYDNLVHATDLLQIVFVTNDLHSRLNQLAGPIAPLHHVSVDLTDEAICSISNVQSNAANCRRMFNVFSASV